MSDSDDDLLELAGISSADESDHEPQTVTKRRAGARKRGLDDDEEDDDNDDDDDDEEDDIEELNPEEDPYPLEGKYKNEADKNELMKMDEITREGILYDRIQEKEKFRERRFLALRARQSKVESKSIRKGASSSAKKLKTSKLSELKRQRERKNNKDSRRYNEGEDDEDDRYEDEDDEDDDDDLRQLAGYNDEDDEDDEDGYYSDNRYASSSKRYTRGSDKPSRSSRSARSRNEYDQNLYKDASLDEINNKIRSTRTVLEKFLYRDEFDTCIPGTVVRINIGTSQSNNAPQYRMAMVEEVKRGGNTYQLLGKICNTYLKVSQGESTNIVDLSCLSNSPILPAEFESYKKKVDASTEHYLPTLKYVEDKFLELRNMATKQLTDADINKMMARKQELSLDNMNMADRVKKLGKLREDLDIAVQLGEKSSIQKIQEEINKLSQYFQSNKNTSKLEQINIRNQKSNQEFIRKAEKKLVESRRKQMQNNDFSDPFSRLRTNLKIFYRSNEKLENNVKEEEKKVDVEEERSKIKKSIFRREGIDALIKNIDIDLDVVLDI